MSGFGHPDETLLQRRSASMFIVGRGRLEKAD
jgi:hypothetical protein